MILGSTPQENDALVVRRFANEATWFMTICRQSMANIIMKQTRRHNKRIHKIANTQNPYLRRELIAHYIVDIGAIPEHVARSLASDMRFEEQFKEWILTGRVEA